MKFVMDFIKNYLAELALGKKTLAEVKIQKTSSTEMRFSQEYS